MKSLFGALFLLATLPAVASAQSDGQLAMGLTLGSRIGVKDGTAGDIRPGIVLRPGHGRDGFGWELGLSWYSADLQQPVDQTSTDFGQLHVRPLLAGYGYTLRLPRRAKTRPDQEDSSQASSSTPRRRVAFNARLLGGYAFTSLDVHSTFVDSYSRRLDVSAVQADVANAFVLKPEVSAWIDVSRKVGLLFSAGYMLSRPQVTVTSSAGRDTRRANADVVMLTVGTVYSVF